MATPPAAIEGATRASSTSASGNAAAVRSDVAGGAIAPVSTAIVGPQFLGNSGSNAGASARAGNLRVYSSEFTGNAASVG
jgi:hypothetical protein